MNRLATLESFELHDAAELDAVSSDWNIDSLQLRPGRHRFTAERIIFPDLMVEHYSTRIARHDIFELPPDTTLITLFRPGVPAGHWCGHEIPAEVALVNQSGREHFAVVPDRHEGIALLVSNQLVSDWQLLPDTLYRSADASRRQIIPVANDTDCQFQSWLFAQVSRQSFRRTLTRDPIEAGLFRNQMLERLGVALQSGIECGRRYPVPENTSRRYQSVRRACDIARQRVTENISTAQLADEAGVGVRALQRGFNDVFGMPAFYYLLACKLHAARYDLRAGAPAETSVSRVALRYGFTELGRFSGRYRAMFGELPSQTLRR